MQCGFSWAPARHEGFVHGRTCQAAGLYHHLFERTGLPCGLPHFGDSFDWMFPEGMGIQRYRSHILEWLLRFPSSPCPEPFPVISARVQPTPCSTFADFSVRCVIHQIVRVRRSTHQHSFG